MKYLARIILTAAILSLLAAIWIGPWWAWILTALILLFVGAGISGSNVPDEPHPIDHGLLPEHVAREFVEPSTLEQIADGRTHGTPVHLRDGEILNGTGDPELDRALNARPTYGKPAQKENER